MLQTTTGLVLRTVKYGETSVIVSVFTEKFGIQSYLVNGVRKAGKKGHVAAVHFQPAANLELVVYHNDLKQLNRIKEFRWGHLYENIFSDIHKNAIALFMVEILQKSIRQPEQNEELFYFVEDCFLQLDKSKVGVAANFALFFLLHLAVMLGFRIEDNYSVKESILDLQEGKFVAAHPEHNFYLEGSSAQTTSHLLKVMQPAELIDLKLNQQTRRNLMQAYVDFYRLHLPDFGHLKTLQVLQELLS